MIPVQRLRGTRKVQLETPNHGERLIPPCGCTLGKAIPERRTLEEEDSRERLAVEQGP